MIWATGDGSVGRDQPHLDNPALLRGSVRSYVKRAAALA